MDVFTAIPIVCTVDDGYVVPALVFLESLAMSQSAWLSDLRLCIISSSSSLSPANRGLLESATMRLGIHCKFYVASVPDYSVARGWVSPTVYLRLHVDDLLVDFERALYVDIDTLVLRDIRPLLVSEFRSGQSLAAVQDSRHPVFGMGRALPGWRELGLKKGVNYFNSGVMLMDLRAARVSGELRRARDFAIQHPDDCVFWDQDALNYVYYESWTPLEETWNTFVISPLVGLEWFNHDGPEEWRPLAHLIAIETDAAIAHFAGSVKPWKADYPDGPWKSRYTEFLSAVEEA